MRAALVWYQASFTAHHVGLLGFNVVLPLVFSTHMLAFKLSWNETHKLGLPALLHAPWVLLSSTLARLCTCSCTTVQFFLIIAKRVMRRCFIPLLHWFCTALAVIYMVASGVGWWCPLQNRVTAQSSVAKCYWFLWLFSKLGFFIFFIFLLFFSLLVSETVGGGDGAHLGSHALFQSDSLQSC